MFNSSASHSSRSIRRTLRKHDYNAVTHILIFQCRVGFLIVHNETMLALYAFVDTAEDYCELEDATGNFDS